MYLRWLSDSARFNEWMNPIDYETEEFQQEQEAIAQQSPKGMCSSSTAPRPVSCTAFHRAWSACNWLWYQAPVRDTFHPLMHACSGCTDLAEEDRSHAFDAFNSGCLAACLHNMLLATLSTS